MKVKVESLPEGIIVCHIQQALDRAEFATLTQGVEKVLSNGKARVIIHFSQKAVVDKNGIKLLEKGLRNYQSLARKMGGDIIYVVPPFFLGQIPNSVSDLGVATRQILKKVEGTTVLNQESQADSSKQDPIVRIKSLEMENEALAAKVKELLALVSEPSTHAELANAVEFYRNLALETEGQPPQSLVAQKK